MGHDLMGPDPNIGSEHIGRVWNWFRAVACGSGRLIGTCQIQISLLEKEADLASKRHYRDQVYHHLVDRAASVPFAASRCHPIQLGARGNDKNLKGGARVSFSTLPPSLPAVDWELAVHVHSARHRFQSKT